MLHLYGGHNESKWEKFPRLYFALETRVVNQAEKIFAVEEETARAYARMYPALAKRISFVPNGINEDVFFSYAPEIKKEKKSRRLKEFALAQEDNLILFAGRLDGAKDPLLLIDAFSCLRKSEKNVKLIVAGAGRLETAMRARIAEYGLTGDVKFLGVQAQSELAELMRISDVFLCTSAFEGMPMVVLESQKT